MEICVGEVFTTSSLYYNICETEKTDKSDKFLILLNISFNFYFETVSLLPILTQEAVLFHETC